MGENKLDEKIIVVSGKDVILSRLQRHILYSIDEGKPISSKYDHSDVNTAMLSLINMKFVIFKDEEPNLTWDGTLLVNAMRIASETLPASEQAIRATPCEICGQPTKETQRGSAGNLHAVCPDCKLRIKPYKICKLIGHDDNEIERFPYPGREHVSPGILVMSHCRRCGKFTPSLDSIYD